MPFVDTDDDVFLGEKSFATWHEALDRYQTLPYTRILPGPYTRILPGYGAPDAKELFAPDAGVHDGREKEY